MKNIWQTINIKRNRKKSEMVELFETKMTSFLEYYWTSWLTVSVKKEGINRYILWKTKINQEMLNQITFLMYMKSICMIIEIKFKN